MELTNIIWILLGLWIISIPLFPVLVCYKFYREEKRRGAMQLNLRTSLNEGFWSVFYRLFFIKY